MNRNWLTVEMCWWGEAKRTLVGWNAKHSNRIICLHLFFANSIYMVHTGRHRAMEDFTLSILQFRFWCQCQLNFFRVFASFFLFPLSFWTLFVFEIWWAILTVFEVWIILSLLLWLIKLWDVRFNTLEWFR